MVLVLCVSGCIENEANFERKQLFDSDWKFDLGDTELAASINFNDENWRSINLPHDWSIEGEISPDNPTAGAGGYFPAGIGWYRKTFKAPAEWEGKNISIYFEGVYMNSEVFINGKSLGVYPYGYTSFKYNLTPYLNFEKENVIAVRVDNSQQLNCRWFSGSGIYRHVWMLVTEPVHIAHWGVDITTPEVSSEKANVQLKTRVKNETGQAQNIVVKTLIRDKNSKSVGNAQVEIQLAPHSEDVINQSIDVLIPLLWSPDTPDLYQAKMQVMNGNEVIDHKETSFGIRSIAFSAEDGFELNGKKTILNGGCVHHDNGILGAAAFDRAEYRRVELLKAAGFNAVRTAHNIPSEAFLTACDELGLLVVDEAFDGWRAKKNPYDYSLFFDKWWKKDLKAMVLRDRNHPSIIMWSIGNEVIERKEPEAVEIAKMMAKEIKNFDTTRPVTSAMTTWDNEWEIFDPLMEAHDVCGYNYQLHRAPADHKRVPSRIIVNTESYPADAFNIWKLVSENDYILGDFVWTAMDYLGESGIGAYYYPGENADEHWQSERYPWHGACCGDIDLTGWRKPVSHYRNMLYNDNEKLFMAVKEPNPEGGSIKTTSWAVWPTWESWTWPGFEGKDIEVEVYSKYPKVRLYLNNQFIGEKATTIDQEYKANFLLPYAMGELKAVGVVNDKEIESSILQTSGHPAKIKLTADREEILADGQDLSFVMIEISDKDGMTHPNAENLLQFKVEGNGTIAGLGNANLQDNEPYIGNTCKAWKGRALVIIRSTDKGGDIKLTVNSPDLSESVLFLKSKM